MLKALLIDDEPDCLRLLELQLGEHCPQIEIVGQFTSSMEGLHAIRALDPDVLFLDVEMPEMDGFAMLGQLGEISFSLIFITAYNEFAIKAFRYSALDYLLKPLDTGELQEAVAKAEKRQRIDQRQIQMLQTQWQGGQHPQKIAVPSRNGVTFIELKDLSYCEADSNYTKLFVTHGKSHLLSKTLREVQQVLEERNFLRVHRHYLINLDHIKSYHKGEAAYLEMEGGTIVPVAKSQKQRLEQKFGWL